MPPWLLLGSATSTTPLSSPLLLLSPARAGASPQLLIAPSADGAQLAHAELARVAGGGERAALQLVTLSSLMPSSEQMPKQPLRLRAHSAGLASLDFPSGITFALLHSATGAAEVTPLGAATASPQVLLQWSPAGAAVGVLNQASPPTTHVLALRTGEVAGSLLFEVTEAGSGTPSASETLSAPGDASPPLTAFLGTFSKRDGSRGFRCAAVAADHALSLLQQGQTAWLREEALAEVTQLLFLEPQSSGSGAAVGAHAASVPSGAVVAPWHSRVAAMLRSVAASGASSQGVGATSPAPRDWPRALPPQRDEHGFSRLLVALTAAGKVLALRSDDGRVVWSWTPPPGTAPPSTLLLWRSGAAPLLLLAGSAGDNATALAWLDGHSGAALGTTSAPLAATRLVPLEAVDREGRCVLLLWQRDGGRLALFPDTPEAAHAAAGALARTSLFWAGEASEDWAVRGFALAPGPALTRALPSWSLALPGPPLALAARPPSHAVFSRTRVLGDRSTLHKYLNPNTLLVASASVGGADGLEVLLVDTVTGRVLYRVRHARGSGPVAAAAADNCFIYTYWDTAAQRTEVSVLELFDEGAGRGGGGRGAAVLGALLATSAPLPAASPDAALRGASSLAPPALRIMGQSYSLAAQTAGLGFTVTRRGLTSRQLLLATRAGRLLALDRRFLDPRRPTRPSAADREEGLVPYSEALPLLPGAYLTGASRLARPRFLAAAPAALESACHVAALGLDLFYARAAPSRTFDTLGDNFSRPLLAVTLAALSLGAAAAAWAVKRDDLARQWR